MAQACLTQYFTPKRARHSSSAFDNVDSQTKQRKKFKVEDENNENLCSSPIVLSVSKRRRISPTKPTDGRLQSFDLDQIDKSPLTRRNDGEKVLSDRQQRLSKIADMTELRKRLKAVRHHLDKAKEYQHVDSIQNNVPHAHERFADLLGEKPALTPVSKRVASPADLRRFVQETQTERLKKVLSKVDQSVIETLPITPSKRIAGVNERLLEQIRLKEEHRSQLTSLENTGVVASEEQRTVKLEMFSRMRESLDIIDQLFTTERQVALEWDRVTGKLVELHSARFTTDQATTMIDFIIKSLDESIPGFLLALKIRNKQYVKINRNKASMSELAEYIAKKVVEFGE